MNLSNRSELEKILNPLPAAFNEAGLALVGTEQSSSDLAGVTTSFIFVNTQSQIRLRLSVCEKYCALSAFILRDKSVYELQEYLNYKKRQKEYSADFFSVGIDKYVENLCKLITNEWGDIITGKKWEGPCSPVQPLLSKHQKAECLTFNQTSISLQKNLLTCFEQN